MKVSYENQFGNHSIQFNSIQSKSISLRFIRLNRLVGLTSVFLDVLQREVVPIEVQVHFIFVKQEPQALEFRHVAIEAIRFDWVMTYNNLIVVVVGCRVRVEGKKM